MPQRHVAEAQLGDRGIADLDRAAAQVDADEFAAGKLVGHRNEIAAVAAAEFKHAAARGGRRRHAVEARLRGDVVGMRLGERMAAIEDAIVGGVVWQAACPFGSSMQLCALARYQAKLAKRKSRLSCCADIRRSSSYLM